MNLSYSNFLDYWRNSLADGGRMCPPDSYVREGIRISNAQLESGRLGPELTQELYSKADDTTGKSDTVLPVLILPLVLARVREHGAEVGGPSTYLSPIIVSAGLTRTGNLIRDADSKPPVIARDLLEPTPRSNAIGSIEDADYFYASNIKDLSKWQDALAFTRTLFEFVTTQTLSSFELSGWERDPGARVLLLRDYPEALHLLRLYDWLRGEEPRPLIVRLLSEVTESPLLAIREQLKVSEDHLGHFASKNSLAPSQRLTLLHLLNNFGDAGQITVVNGPPGTGKTTLIQNIVASIWVGAALRQAPCPLIVATSSSNQAVTNVNKAFDENETNGETALSGRWLSKVTSFGMFMPSARASRANSENGSQIRQIYEEMPRRGVPSRHFASHYETKDGLEEGKREFLEKFIASRIRLNGALSIENAKAAIHGELKRESSDLLRITKLVSELFSFSGSKSSLHTSSLFRADLLERVSVYRGAIAGFELKLSSLNSILLAWNRHRGSEPWWMTLFLFIPSVRRRQGYRDTAFFVQHCAALNAINVNPDTSARDFEKQVFDLQKGLRESQTQARIALESTEKMLRSFEERLFQLEAWCKSQGISGEEEDIFGILDTRVRYRMFQLAAHYWEASYLSEVELLLKDGPEYEDSLSPPPLERHYRRLAKLAPCFISTIHMLPKWFRGYSRETQYLVDAIDLLIVDEAGQVSPENGAAVFALAKRACIFGDKHQIEPVWAVPESIDRINASRYLDIQGVTEYENLAERGFMAGNGSVLSMTQGVSVYSTHKDVAPGFFLTEHRRCLPRIISYCNKLVYRGFLESCRPHEEFQHKLPPFGWMHIRGSSKKNYGSQVNEIEADSIAAWISANAEKLRETYPVPLKEIIAVLTPFAAQSRRIQTALRMKGLGGEKLTVGTLHAMQGAERRVIIFSPTYGSNHHGAVFFNKSSTLLNVAVSRAKDAFLVMGNMDLFRGETGPAGLLGEFLFDDIDNELEVSPQFSPGYLDNQGQSEVLSTLEQHRAALARVFETARERVIVVSPFLTSKALSADAVPEMIRRACARGVRTIIVSDLALHRDKVGLKNCVRILESAGANVCLARERGIHCKVLCRDDDVFVQGSFNWLAAVREEGPYRRYEISYVQIGAGAKSAITSFMDDMARHVSWPSDSSRRTGNE